MNMEQMHYIVEVAKTKSISIASTNLFVTQSALSQSISNLEVELGINIFTRSRLGTIPTPEGEKMIKKAVEIVKKVQEMKEEAQNLLDVLKGELRIVSIPVGLTPLIKTVSGFKNDYPQTDFRIMQKSTKEILHDLKEFKADLGLIVTKKDFFKNDKHFNFDPIWEGKIVIGVNKNSPLASKKSINAEELLNHPFVLYEDDHVSEFTKNFTEKFGPLQTLFTSNNSVAIIYALKAGLAVTCGHDFTFINSPVLSKGDLITLEIDNYEQESIEFGWVSWKNKGESSLSKRFMNRFAQEIQYDNLS
jgi:DNA-binding transcriptional LysR family regulator